jgi:hypothetical protein
MSKLPPLPSKSVPLVVVVAFESPSSILALGTVPESYAILVNIDHQVGGLHTDVRLG